MRRWIVLVLLMTAPAAAWPQLNPDSAQRIDQVFAAINRTDSPGCVLGVNRGGQPLYRHGYGMASLEFGVPMNENSVVESGSVAKQFTAGAIVHLALNGKLDLEDPVRKYLPDLPDYGTPITIRMLLNHTSGIRDMWTLFTLAGQPMGTVLFKMDQALRMIYRQQELNFPPNSQFLYSNSGYLLLAEIVQRVSGKPLAEYSAEVFFKPLGMQRTQWRNDWNRLVTGRVTAYTGNASTGWRVEMPFMSVYGAGGLLSTVGDMLAWNEHLDSPRIGGRAWVDSLERRGRLTSGREIDYALGLFVTKYRGEREVSHTGATGGYRTYLARLPERKLSMAVLCNFGSANPERLGHQVADIFIGPRPAETATAGTSSSGGDLSAYVGQFRAAGTEESVSFSIQDGKLVADAGIRLPLTAAGPDRFTADEAMSLVFHRGPDGKVGSVSMVTIDQDTTHYERSATPPSTATEIASYAGGYYSGELDVSYTLRASDTTLMLQVPGQAESPLSRTARDSFAGPLGTALRFTRAKANKVDGFLLFAGRVRNLRFTRR